MKYLRVPQNDRDPNRLEGYAVLHEGAAIVDRPERRLLRLTGKDPVGMLNALLTNDVPTQVNRGAYALLLNPKGRVQTDLRAVKVAEEILIDTDPEGSEAAKEILGRYAPFSRVKLEELFDWKVLGLYGPRASDLLEKPDLEEHETKKAEIGGVSVLIVGVSVPVGGYDLIGPSEALGAVRERLIGLGAILADFDSYETARIAAGVPRFGADITPENFPGESEDLLERAVSFEKGCYPGQETVARMHYRGHPNKELHRFAVEGTPPAPGTPISQNGRQVGKATSVAPLPVDGRYLALGYLSRNADKQGVLQAGEATLRSLA
jgi:folate-binding protein YgfZ